MEREVFEDSAIAHVMNEKLVCIKVDREERPDIDRVYMHAVQAMTGGGGWPMSVFMTPDRKPFFGGTYIPPKAQYGRPGFPDLVNRIDSLWRNERAKLVESGEQMVGYLQNQATPSERKDIGAPALDSAFERISRSYDPDFAGFGGGPKFPRPVNFDFLFRYYARTANDSSLEMTLATLRAMARGGMYDQIGGGFHRYSVDGQWRVPHFEKMLYDQAQLIVSYLDAYQITHEPIFAQTAREVVDYVLRDMISGEGGFFSAEDAESALDSANPKEKEEGEFYLWRKEEIEELLGKENADIFNYYFDVRDSGNALNDPQHIFTGKNIPYIAHTREATASHFHLTNEQLGEILTRSRGILFSAREKRPRPQRDDKVITAWNGLMISACSKAYQVLGDRQYLSAAERAAAFVESHLYDAKREILLRRYRDGDARFDAGLQDYAFYVAGLIDLYEASFKSRWLESAIGHSRRQLELFLDSTSGGFFDVTGTDPTLLLRTKEDYDGAEPTGNSVSAMNYLRLGQMTDNKPWIAIAERTIGSFGSRLQASPEILPGMLAALCRHLSSPREIIVAGHPGSDGTQAMLKEIRGHFLPFAAVFLADGGDEQKKLSSYLPFVKEMRMRDGKATAYICDNYSCNLPTTDIRLVGELLTKETPEKDKSKH